MSSSEPGQEARDDANRCFAATHWSVVLAAGETDSLRRTEALETLCRTYWPPLYSFIRRFGYEVHDAQDLTQDFLAHLLARNPFATLGPEKGKFRSFLLVALKHFLADDRAKVRTTKRGGGQVVLSLDQEVVEAGFLQDSSPDLTAEKLFDRRWAWTLMDRAFARLQDEFAAAGKSETFARLKPFLSSEGSAAQYDAVAVESGVTPGAVAVAVHRMRQRYRALVREEVAHTVASPIELEDEMRYLLDVLRL
jgi:RNA polymerase sigma-70 factor (ECF subfamily)